MGPRSLQQPGGAVQPAAVQPVVGTGFHAVLGFEMAAHAPVAGDRVHHQQLVLPVQPVQAGQRRVQAVEAAEVQQRARGAARLGWQQGAAQPGQMRVAIGHHGGHAVQRAAQQHHHEAALGGGGAREARPSVTAPTSPSRAARRVIRRERCGRAALSCGQGSFWQGGSFW